MQEKAIRTGAPVDVQFTEFVEPQDASIQVAISSDVRQVGKFRLMQKIASFLRSEGYSNVTLYDAVGDYPVDVEDSFPTADCIIEKQKKVHIDLKIVE